MSISIHTHSVNWNFRGSSSGKYRGHRSMKMSAVRHIQRTDKDVQGVKQHTKSAIHANLTNYNVVMTPNGEQNLLKAQKLIDERLKARENAKTDWTAENQKELDKAKLKVRSTRKAYSRAIKNGNSAERIAEKKKLWDNAKLNSARLSQQRKNSLSGANKKYKTWTPNVGVGGFSTIQLSKSTLKKLGWQFIAVKYINHRTNQPYMVDVPYNVQDQINYDKTHHTNGFDRTEKTYNLLFNAVKNDPQHFGTMVSGSIHFDETIPHLDFLTLDLGVDLNGKSLGHIGEQDNGTNNDLLNVRHRTFINGTNAVGVGDNDRNRHYTSHLQDVLSDGFKKESVKTSLQKVTNSSFERAGLTRGVDKNDRAKQRKEQLQLLKIDEQGADNLLSLATSAHQKAQSTLSSAIATNSSASLASSKASLNRKNQIESIATSLNLKYQAEYKASESALKTSYEAMTSDFNTKSKAASTAHSIASSAIESKSSANSSANNSLKNSMIKSIDNLLASSTAFLNSQSITQSSTSIAQSNFKTAMAVGLHTLYDKDNYKNKSTNQNISKLIDGGVVHEKNAFQWLADGINYLLDHGLKASLKKLSAVFGGLSQAENQRKIRNRNERINDLNNSGTDYSKSLNNKLDGPEL